MLITDRTGKNEKGFTLIEALVAMVILAIALLGIAQMQISAMQGNRSSYDTTEASALASDMLEQLVLQSWNNPDVVNCPPDDSVAPANITYSRHCDLGAGSTGQRLATVTVTWTGVKKNLNNVHTLVVNSLL
ncbi:MAG TPA: prepilin-type N-terminal cleavage/methylation domain-containing protein [Nitrospiria bacterium]|nr:prepilin-type N-terminal cleavage/methylation domain-containing protein [Nitrospiria bacterium]